jgi:uncharacterized membrane protein YraQ (UPF0718 family)
VLLARDPYPATAANTAFVLSGSMIQLPELFFIWSVFKARLR